MSLTCFGDFFSGPCALYFPCTSRFRVPFAACAYVAHSKRLDATRSDDHAAAVP